MTTEQDNTTQTTEQTTNHSEIFNSLRIPDAIKDLPKFDGNPRLLFEFLNNVEEILLHIRGTDNTPYGQILLRAIRNKVEGQANEILNMYGTPLIWDDIKTNLILHYSDKRTETSLIRDLHNIRQYNKTIQSFYGEIIEIQSALCNNILIQEINPSVIQAKKNLYSEMCLNSFLSGLNEPLGSRVRTMQPDSLATALSCCIKEQNISYQRYSQQYRYRPYNYNSGQNQTYPYNSKQNPRYTNNLDQNQTYPYNPRQNPRYTSSSGQNQSRTYYNNQNQWQSNNPFSKSPQMRNTQNFNELSHSRTFQKKETQFNKFQNPNSFPKIKTSPSQQFFLYSLQESTGYIDSKSHPTTLPFINISSPFGRPLRFLLDTGASASFINPEYIPHGELLHCDPVTITTVFKKYELKTQTNVKIFKEFNQDGLLKFLIFKFHNFFDGLLGLDTLLQLNAKIDLENKILVTKNSVVEIHFKPNESSDVLNVPAQSKILAKLPVNKLNGDIILNTIELKPDVFISQGIYRAINGYSTVEITNYSESDENILLEESLQSTEYQPEEYLELNNLHITPEEDKTTERKNIEHLLRTDHLNREEKNQLLKLCKRYNDIIYIEGEQLTFSNQIKHTINTTDDVPIYMKSYRYPYIHKQEVQDQISKMLEQGIIRQSYSPWSSPVWIVPKKSDASGKQKWRLVIDYRKVNEKNSLRQVSNSQHHRNTR
ncbi:uncharacterized protein LOC129908283 [Episyrphus balteatus]|uniref:uncharacterized protein LOC129908283 n=1 Tax=Episyrphus balteatus TaxID=286459 RepID=UPI0024860ED3|nr:uncharacterized protein LOC129908283 [Episyrphus balteatus]